MRHSRPSTAPPSRPSTAPPSRPATAEKGRPPKMVERDGPEVQEIFYVDVDKSSGDGLGVRIHPAETALQVTAVREDGLIPRWNVANPECAVEVGDRIIAVNEACGPAKDLSNECKKNAF